MLRMIESALAEPPAPLRAPARVEPGTYRSFAALAAALRRQQQK
jgi:hypothetical protein